jgi:serine/threonine protein kinase
VRCVELFGLSRAPYLGGGKFGSVYSACVRDPGQTDKEKCDSVIKDLVLEFMGGGDASASTIGFLHELALTRVASDLGVSPPYVGHAVASCNRQCSYRGHRNAPGSHGYLRLAKGEPFQLCDLRNDDRQNTKEWREKLKTKVRLLNEHGILHFDIKPENLVRIGEQLYIIDYGSAAWRGENRLVEDVMANDPGTFEGFEAAIQAYNTARMKFLMEEARGEPFLSKNGLQELDPRRARGARRVR